MNLPNNMETKIVHELCPISGLNGFCWTWTGAINSRGYGCIGIKGKSQLSHRVAYQLLVGEIPNGLVIDHLCQNKRCCNPDHLEPVTAKKNSERAPAANKTFCVNGHRYTAENTIWRKRGQLRHRDCRECAKQRKRAYRASKVGAQ